MTEISGKINPLLETFILWAYFKSLKLVKRTLKTMGLSLYFFCNFFSILKTSLGLNLKLVK